MTRPDPAEPSMDEILASIRKIIAEDPIGSTGGPDDGPPKPPAAMKDAASSGEFDLPSVFRPKPAPERGGSLFGRLTGAAPAPQATPAPFSASLGHRAKPADEQLSDLVENDLGDLLADSEAPAAAVVPPPAPGLPPGASLSVLPITELMRADTDSHVADMPEPSLPARSEPRFTAMPPPVAPASKPGRLEDRLPPIAAHPSGMGKTEPPHDTASRDQAIANALGALVPGKIDQPMTGFRLPPIGGAPSGPSSFGRRPGATVEAPAAEAVAVP